MAKKEKKDKMALEDKCTIAITASVVGLSVAVGGMYAYFMHKQRVKSDETFDKIAENSYIAHNAEAYLNTFINHICGKSEKVKDVLIEEGIIIGDGWGLPIKEEDLTE